jgi:hypothetical protein
MTWGQFSRGQKAVEFSLVFGSNRRQIKRPWFAFRSGERVTGISCNEHHLSGLSIHDAIGHIKNAVVNMIYIQVSPFCMMKTPENFYPAHPSSKHEWFPPFTNAIKHFSSSV